MKQATKKAPQPTSKKSSKLFIDGLQTIIAQADSTWDIIVKRMSQMGQTYGFQKVETPIIESPKVFEPYLSSFPFEVTPIYFDIVGEQFAIRPNLLPQILKRYATERIKENHQISKWMYFGNVMSLKNGSIFSGFDFGIELMGEFSHLTEAQTIAAVWHLVQGLGLKNAELEINTVGKLASQQTYTEALEDFLKNKKYDLCESCTENMKRRVLNVLRCGSVECQSLLTEAPTILDFLDEDSQKQFTQVLEALDELQIPYQMNQLYVGPEGSTKTNWIIRYKHDDKTVVIGEGAHHDLLSKPISGEQFSCMGFQGDISNIYTAMKMAEIEVKQDIKCEVFLVPLGELASKKSLRLFQDLTVAEVKVYDHFGLVGVKNQLKQAEEYKSPIALIMGQKEAVDEMVILRDVKSGMQELFSYDKIVVEVKKRLGK